LAKLIAHGTTREAALVRMRRALDEFVIGGIRTNIALHRRILDDAEVRAGSMTTRSVERILHQSAS
jgi:acetyl-CoA carboxylase biotin carboxylase subunit